MNGRTGICSSRSNIHEKQRCNGYGEVAIGWVALETETVESSMTLLLHAAIKDCPKDLAYCPGKCPLWQSIYYRVTILSIHFSMEIT